MITVTDDVIKNNNELMLEFLRSRGIDGAPGTVVGEMLVRPCGYIMSVTEQSFENVLNNMDLDTADDEYASKILSNYNLVPSSAGTGAGYLVVFTKSSDDLTVRRTVSFRVGGAVVALSRDYIGTTSYSDMSPGVYVPLKKYDDDTYYMLIEGFTVDDMVAPILPGTAAVPSQTIPGASGVEVATAFEATGKIRTLEDLKEDVSNGVAAKILTGPAHIKALLEENGELPVKDTSVVGMGDEEMRRDTDNIYGTSSGGYVDIYVKTSEYPQIKEVIVTGTALGEGRYRAMLGKDQAPGFYYIKSVSYGDMGKTADPTMFDCSFGTDLTDESYKPHFPTPADSRFTSFQNCTVEFGYDGIDSSETNPVFTFELVYIPGIKNVQDFVASPERRSPTVDYAVKAAVPTLLSVSLNISYESSSERPDEAIIQQIVAESVNKIPMGQRFLSGAEIACAIGKIYPDAVVKLPILIDAVMVDTGGNFSRVRSEDTLEIPDMAELGISDKTVAFMLNPADVGVSLTGDKL